MDANAQGVIRDIIQNTLEKAYHDSILLGIGVVVFRPDLTVEYVPPEKYLQMADALKWAHRESKLVLPKD